MSSLLCFSEELPKAAEPTNLPEKGKEQTGTSLIIGLCGYQIKSNQVKYMAECRCRCNTQPSTTPSHLSFILLLSECKRPPTRFLLLFPNPARRIQGLGIGVEILLLIR